MMFSTEKFDHLPVGGQEGQRGAYIVFEGGDGSGKSTQVQRLGEKLGSIGVECVVVREPGGTDIGADIRRMLLTQGTGMGSLTEAYLFAADRSHLMEKVIVPAIMNRVVVLSDRSVISSIAYQGGGRQMGIQLIKSINAPATEGRSPDNIVIINMPLGQALEAETEVDKFGLEERAFHERTQQVFADLTRDMPGVVLPVDGRGSMETVEQRVWQAVKPLISKMSVI